MGELAEAIFVGGPQHLKRQRFPKPVPHLIEYGRGRHRYWRVPGKPLVYRYEYSNDPYPLRAVDVAGAGMSEKIDGGKPPIGIKLDDEDDAADAEEQG